MLSVCHKELRLATPMEVFFHGVAFFTLKRLEIYDIMAFMKGACAVALSDPNTIKALLRRHGFHFSKALGQNFLIHPDVCPDMADACGLDSSSGVLEIGPGVGVLTCELAARAGRVVAVELDRRLFPLLEETLRGHDNVKLVQGDALKLDLHRLLEEEFLGQRAQVCANLPYYITSPVIMRFLEERLPISRITVMVQKEAAQRLCAPPGTRAAGAVSLAVSYYAEASILFDVSRESFMPAPSVDSAVIQLTVRPAPAVDVPSEKRFFSVIAAAFGQRRKTLCNALSAGLGRPKEDISGAMNRVGLDPQIRAERLTLPQFAALDRALFGDAAPE